MADDKTKTVAGVGLGLALVGGLLAAFGGGKKKPAGGLGGPLPPRKGCNCSGR